MSIDEQGGQPDRKGKRTCTPGSPPCPGMVETVEARQQLADEERLAARRLLPARQ